MLVKFAIFTVRESVGRGEIGRAVLRNVDRGSQIAVEPLSKEGEDCGSDGAAPPPGGGP